VSIEADSSRDHPPPPGAARGGEGLLVMTCEPRLPKGQRIDRDESQRLDVALQEMRSCASAERGAGELFSGARDHLLIVSCWQRPAGACEAGNQPVQHRRACRPVVFAHLRFKPTSSPPTDGFDMKPGAGIFYQTGSSTGIIRS